MDAYDIEIIGSDIDTRMLEAATDCTYGRRALMRLSPGIVDKYFEQLDEDRWRIIEDIRQSVQFSRINIVEATEAA